MIVLIDGTLYGLMLEAKNKKKAIMVDVQQTAEVFVDNCKGRYMCYMLCGKVSCMQDAIKISPK